jgi:PKD repeat protein
VQDPVHTFLNAGNYSVQLTTGNASGYAVQSSSRTIMVFPTGDFNTNGRIDIGDVTRVAYMAAGLIPADLSADFNNNEQVETADAAKIAWYYIGKIPGL